MPTRRAARAGASAFLLLVLAATAQAAAPPSPADAVDAFHLALRKGDAAKALDRLAKDCTVYEQGFTDLSRDEWARHQLRDAMAFAGTTDYRVLSRQSRQSGDAAWVLSTTRTTGAVEGRKLELDGTETAILQQDGGAWKIVHLHWSAHERRASDADAPPAAAAPSADAPAPPLRP